MHILTLRVNRLGKPIHPTQRSFPRYQEGVTHYIVYTKQNLYLTQINIAWSVNLSSGLAPIIAYYSIFYIDLAQDIFRDSEGCCYENRRYNIRLMNMKNDIPDQDNLERFTRYQLIDTVRKQQDRIDSLHEALSDLSKRIEEGDPDIKAILNRQRSVYNTKSGFSLEDEAMIDSLLDP